MAVYTKAWVIPWETGRFGIAYERADGIQGFTSLEGPHHSDILELITMLSDADLRKLKERQPNVIPFPRS